MIIQMIIPLLLLPLMVKNLGNELYGLWILFTTIIAYLGISGFGFGTTFIKEVSKSDNTHILNTYFNTTLMFYLLISLILIPINIYIYVNLENLFLIDQIYVLEAKRVYVLFVLTFYVNFLSSLLGSLLFAKNLLYLQNYLSIIISISSFVSMYVALYFGYSIITLGLINLFFSLCSMLLLYLIVKRKVTFELSWKHFDMHTLKQMFHPSIHYFFITASAMIILYSDNIIISSFIGLSSLTLFYIAYKVVSIPQNLLFKIVDVAIPDISKMYEKKQYKQIIKLHNKMLVISLIMGIFGFGFLHVYGLDLIGWWVGEERIINTNVFHVFIYFAIIHAGVHVSAVFLVAMGEHTKTSYMTMVDASLNIIISIVLLQYYGLLGIALGTLIAHLCTSAWFTTWWFYKIINSKINVLS